MYSLIYIPFPISDNRFLCMYSYPSFEDMFNYLS